MYLVTWRGTSYRSVPGDTRYTAAMAGKLCYRWRNSSRERTGGHEFFGATKTTKPEKDQQKIIGRIFCSSICLSPHGMGRRRLQTKKHVGKTTTIGSIILS